LEDDGGKRLRAHTAERELPGECSSRCWSLGESSSVAAAEDARGTIVSPRCSAASSFASRSFRSAALAISARLSSDSAVVAFIFPTAIRPLYPRNIDWSLTAALYSPSLIFACASAITSSSTIAACGSGLSCAV